MTYSNKVKRELLQEEILEPELFLNILINEKNKEEEVIKLLLYSNKIAEKTIECLKRLNIKYKFEIENRKIFNKTKVYIIEFKKTNNNIIINNKEEFLRYSFIILGNINDPKSKTYHLEFLTKNSDMALNILEILNSNELNAKLTKRKNKYLVYVKKQEEISDILLKIGCKDEYFYFLDTSMKKEISGNLKKTIAFSIANQQKTNKSALAFLEIIKNIKDKDKFELLSENQKRIIEIREENQEASLNELVEIYKERYKEEITKSKLQHQMNKIKEIEKD